MRGHRLLNCLHKLHLLLVGKISRKRKEGKAEGRGKHGKWILKALIEEVVS